MKRHLLQTAPIPDVHSEDQQITISQWIVILFTVGLLTLLFTTVAIGFPAFHLRFNWFGLLSLLAVVTNIGAFILVARVRARTDDLMWFALQIFMLAIWAFSEVMTRLSALPETAIFWSALGSVGAFMMPATFYMFALSYTNPRQARHALTVVPLMTTTVCLMFFDFRTNLFNNYVTESLLHKPWGYVVTAGPYFGVMVAWMIVLYLVSIGVLYNFYRRSIEPTLKAQAKLFMIATIVPVAGGVITDGLLPALGFNGVLPIGVLLTAAMGLAIAYGLHRYRFFTFNPVLVASNVLDTMNEAVVSVSTDFKVEYVNRGAERLLGYNHDQFAKMRFSDFLSQKWTLGLLKKALVKPLEHTQYAQFDSVDLHTARGTTLTAKLSVSKVVEEGELRGYLIVMTDISKIARATEIIERTVSERTREVREAQATLITSINSLKLGFLIVNAVPEVLRLNTVAHGLFCPNSTKHSAGECREVKMAQVQAQLGEGFDAFESVKNCLSRQLPKEIKNVSFAHRDWRVYLSPMVVDRESIGCVILLQDTTEERMLERSRDEFFSIASHELRTPLTSIKGNSSLIKQYYAKILKDPILREMVDDIHESSERLIEIVNDFLDVSRLEQNRIEFHLEQLSVAKVIEEVAYGVGPLIKQKGLRLMLSHSIRRLDALPMAIADKNRLKQILFNLIGNATKFTDKGKITVDAEEKDGFITVAVTDTGAGIAQEEQNLLFHKFQQANNSILTRDASQGTGLGLYISRLLASGMGGTLKLVRSAPGKGSTFAVTVPVATAARLKALPPQKPLPNN